MQCLSHVYLEEFEKDGGVTDCSQKGSLDSDDLTGSKLLKGTN